MLSKEKINLLLSYRHEDFTLELIESKFTPSEKEDAFFPINESFILPANKINNSSAITTTVGRYFVNFFLFHPKLIKLVPYYNKPLSKDVLKDIIKKVTLLLMDDKITASDMSDFIDRFHWIGFALSAYFSVSSNVEFITPLNSVRKLKEKSIKENADKIKNKDAMYITKLGKELTEVARNELKNNDSLDIFDSGSAKDFNNTYKNMCIMRGTIKDISAPGQYHVALDNLMDGIEKENLYKYAELSIDGSYSRGVSTAVGGYLFKKMSMAFQSVVLDKNINSDCKSKNTLKVLVTPHNVDKFIYRYIVSGSSLIQLTHDNIDNYLGKVINLRSPMFCTADQICAKCAGTLYHHLQIYNVGLVTGRVGQILQTQSMKCFHDSTIKTKKIDIFSKISKV